ncbi:MAG: NfeD family protein [bacterium]
MKRPLIIFFIISGFLSLILLFSVEPQNCLANTENGDAKNQIYLIKVDGEIDLGLAPFIKRVVEDADKEGKEALILEINTFGGRLDAAVQIRDALLNADTLTIAYINERAISAGALISLACRKIVMAPGSTIGAATPVTIGLFDQEAKPASEKVISYFRKEMKATAEKNGRPTLLAEAMVDPDVVIEGLSEKGKLLTLTTSEAIQNKLADFEVSGGLQEILSSLNLQQSTILTQKPNWAERFLRTISGSLLSSLLLAIGLVALFLEFKTPTWGVAGTIGIICLILFFWGHWVLQLVGWEEIVLLAIGLFLLILEAFIPGFGLPGILGIITLGIAFTLSLVGKNPTSSELWRAVAHMSMVFFFVLVFLIISIKSLAKTRVAQRFVLHARTEPALPASKEEQMAEGPSLGEKGKKPETNQDHYLGREGVAFTNLRPAGKGVFGNERLNVVTDGDFIEIGAPVRIIRVEGSKIIVHKIKEKKQD